MFENILHQNVTNEIARDIQNKTLPNALLFYGPRFSGKLSCALETARILSCEKNGEWQCTCASCKMHRSLNFPNVLLLGTNDATLDIAASFQTFEDALKNNAPYLNASQTLFVRSIRKCLMRFSPIAHQDDAQFSKVSAALLEIEEAFSKFDFLQTETDVEKKLQAAKKIKVLTENLQTQFGKDLLAVQQVRNVSAWAEMKSEKKIIIIENAEKLNEGSRNALLKILEEPPSNVVFILLSENKTAVMQTILSRVRPYHFLSRSLNEEREVIQKIFHRDFSGTLENFFETFLPIDANEIETLSKNFVLQIDEKKFPDIALFVKQLGDLKNKSVARFFFKTMQKFVTKNFVAKNNSFENEKAFLFSREIVNAWNAISVYNISVRSALENLARTLYKIVRTHEI